MKSSPLLFQHMVVPGQVIATVSQQQGDSENESSFLRGHGTHVEVSNTTSADQYGVAASQHQHQQQYKQQRLIASVTGTVQRVNKLISVDRVAANIYDAHTGDLVVGRIVSVGTSRWNVQLVGHLRQAALPLSGVHLPGGVQRIRTAQDAREMRNYLQEGDLVSAEVHKIQTDGTVFLHTRSSRYGKLENGCVVTVPPTLVPRRKNHYYTALLDEFEVLFGCNGMIWIQRKLSSSSSTSSEEQQQQPQVDGGGQQELAQLQEERRAEHAKMPYSLPERQALARLRNSVECLRLASRPITPESLKEVYVRSQATISSVGEMMEPANVLNLTAPQASN